MAIIAEYLTTEYTLQHHAHRRTHTTIAQNQWLDAYSRSGTPTVPVRDKRSFRHFGNKLCYVVRHAKRVETKARPMTIPPFQDRTPTDDRITAYDESHFVEYLRLLDAHAEGADWREAAQIIFGLDASIEPDRARLVHQSHLDRARWMTEHGYRQLLEKARDQRLM
jgi:hypothetical protein